MTPETLPTQEIRIIDAFSYGWRKLMKNPAPWLIMAVAAVAAGADGLLLEVHPDPEQAMSDGYQSMNFEQFEATMARCRKVAEAVGKRIHA